MHDRMGGRFLQHSRADGLWRLHTVEDTFDTASTRGWTSNVGATLRTDTCGALGVILGGYGRLGQGAWLQKSFDLTGQSHRYVNVELTFVKIDTWDGEEGQVYVDNNLVWSQDFEVSSGEQHCGGGHDWHEDAVAVGPLRVSHSTNAVTLKVTTTLDQTADDESFGIRDVLIEVECGTSVGR